MHAPSQWETTLHCNVVSHWLGVYTKWSLRFVISWMPLVEGSGGGGIYLSLIYYRLTIQQQNNAHRTATCHQFSNNPYNKHIPCGRILSSFIIYIYRKYSSKIFGWSVAIKLVSNSNHDAFWYNFWIIVSEQPILSHKPWIFIVENCLNYCIYFFYIVYICTDILDINIRTR